MYDVASLAHTHLKTVCVCHVACWDGLVEQNCEWDFLLNRPLS